MLFPLLSLDYFPRLRLYSDRIYPAGCSSSNPNRSGVDTIVLPNVVIVLADQWRAQATGYARNADLRTPMGCTMGNSAR